MSLGSCFEISAPNVVAEDFGAEIVVLNLSNGKYFSLTGVAANLWNDITQGHRPQDLLDQLGSVQSESTEAVRDFVLDLTREELIRPVQTESAPISLNMASTMIAFNDGAKPPKLEAFDDMAELILSDPIHDVDEDVGWPVKRAPD